MREYKFRAWDKENEKMLQWDEIKEFPMKYLNSDDGLTEHLQYTGLHDKNGKEIYESDLCSDGDGIVEVLWNDHHQWGCKVIKGGVLSMELTFPLWHWDNCEKNGYRKLEVIGNIHSNPELLNT